MATILSQQMGCTIKSDKYKSVEEFLKQLPGAEEFAKEKALAERKKKDAYAQKYYQEYKKQEQAYHQKGGYALTHLQQNPQHVATERQKSIRKPGKSSGRAQDGWTPLANREKSARRFERVNGWLVEVSDIMSLKEKSGKQNRFTRDKSAWTNRKNARNDKVKGKYPCVTAPTPSPMSEVEKERRRQEMMERNQREQIEQKKLFQEREILLSRLNGLEKVEEWTTCPQCGCSVKAKRLARHEKKVHGLIWTTGEIRSVQKCVRLSGQVSAENSVGKKCNIQKRSNIKKYIPKRKYVPSPKPMNNAEIEDLKRKNLEQMERIAKDRERMKRLRANGSGRLS